MSDWGWVALAFSVVYGTLISYVAWTAWRVRRASKRLQELS
jgi:hypothetical protein